MERVFGEGGVLGMGWDSGVCMRGKFYSESDSAWNPREGGIVLVLIKPASNPAHDSRQTCGNTYTHIGTDVHIYHTFTRTITAYRPPNLNYRDI